LTTLALLGWIGLALAIQIVIGTFLGLRRRHRRAVAQPTETSPAPAPRSRAAWSGLRPFRVRSRHDEDPARTQCSFVLEPVDGAPLPEFQAGQFLTFVLNVEDRSAPGGHRTVTRCYSLSDRPDPAHYRVTIKRVPAPIGRPDLPPGLASNHFHDHVQPGDRLDLRAPSGHFFIDPDPAVPAVLIAGGIGITPMMSMIRWWQTAQPQRPLHLYYGVRHGAEHAFKATLEEAAGRHPSLRLHVAYSRPRAEDRPGIDFQHEGHVDVELLRGTLPHGRHQFYLCGPPALMESLVPALTDWGVPEDDVHFEAFGPASVRKARAGDAAAGPALEVRFARSQRTLTWEGGDANLLDFAERHGVDLESGCRSGGCGSCETRLLAGRVVYDHAPDHDPAPGHCLLCIGRPEGAVVLEA
jgi:hypothetical protein